MDEGIKMYLSWFLGVFCKYIHCIYDVCPCHYKIDERTHAGGEINIILDLQLPGVFLGGAAVIRARDKVYCKRFFMPSDILLTACNVHIFFDDHQAVSTLVHLNAKVIKLVKFRPQIPMWLPEQLKNKVIAELLLKFLYFS